MAYVAGPDLRKLLRSEGPLEPQRALALLEEIAAALDAPHAAGLVHRDVKPGNILVTKTEKARKPSCATLGSPAMSPRSAA